MDRSAVLLAGGFSSTVAQDKSLPELHGKPIIKHIVNAIKAVVEEVVIVTENEEQSEVLSKLFEPDIKFAVNFEEEKGLLLGALTGFNIVKGKYSLLLASDLPLVSSQVVDLFFELCHGKTAVIPRWPDQQIEPLQAVYHTKTAIEAAKISIDDGMFDVEDMIEQMGGVRYISTLAVQEFDPELKTFFKVNSPVDLKMAESLAKPRRTKTAKRR
jgi:molybdopterin-guanine dinucleotide biosynthesis protein A